MNVQLFAECTHRVYTHRPYSNINKTDRHLICDMMNLVSLCMYDWSSSMSCFACQNTCIFYLFTCRSHRPLRHRLHIRLVHCTQIPIAIPYHTAVYHISSNSVRMQFSYEICIYYSMASYTQYKPLDCSIVWGNDGSSSGCGIDLVLSHRLGITVMLNKVNSTLLPRHTHIQYTPLTASHRNIHPFHSIRHGIENWLFCMTSVLLPFLHPSNHVYPEQKGTDLTDNDDDVVAVVVVVVVAVAIVVIVVDDDDGSSSVCLFTHIIQTHCQQFSTTTGNIFLLNQMNIPERSTFRVQTARTHPNT